ncbi:MAG: peptidyl-prolyl cis-trans isomerase [Candidatus Aminicenantes bacterium]|nr:peptidyl-prolyl cis-trans isomerase [Candidatus Aminicenantes bacterium]
MLRKMRKDFKKYSWTLWVVIIVFLVGFSFTDPFRAESGSKTEILSIAGKVLTAQEYYDQVMQTLKSYNEQFNNKLTRAFINQLRVPEQVLQRVVNTAIIRKEAKKLNISVSDEELSDRIKNYNIPANDKKSGRTRVYIFREYGDAAGRFIGVREYKELLARNKIKVKDFEKERKDEIILEKFTELVTGPLVVDEDTLKEKYKLENDNVNLDYIVFRPDRIKDNIEVEDQALQEYYDAHKEDFKSKEKRSGSVIALKFDDFKKEAEITDTELFQYYRENKEQFRIPAKTKVSRIFLKYDDKNKEEIKVKAQALQEELTPENFAAKARELSQDNKAKQGGDHGYEGWKRFTENEKSIIEGKDEKEISFPIDTQQGGFSILYLAEKKKDSQQPLDDVKDRIRDTIQSGMLNRIVKKKLDKIYAKLKDEKDIKAKAEDLNAAVIETGLVAGGDPIEEVDEAGYISRKLFTLKENEVGAPFEFLKGMAIVQLNKIEKPQVEPLDRVKDRVKTKVEMTGKIELLEKESQRVTAKLNGMSDEEKIKKYLKDNKLDASPNTYKRGNKLGYFPVKDDLDEIIFSLPENRYSDPIKFENQVVIVKVKSKKISTDADFSNERKGFYKQKLNELRSNFFASYVTGARERYKFDFFNEELFAQVKDEIMGRFKE